MSEYAIEELIAHKYPMILIDAIISYNHEMIETSLTIGENTPFMFDGEVPSYVAMEYMAQSIAVYCGIQARDKGEDARIGLLSGTRKLELFDTAFHVSDILHIKAYNLYNDGNMASFNCVTVKDEKVAAKARLTVYQPNNTYLNIANE